MSAADRVDRRQRFAAGVRRVPGYRAAREGLVPRLRSNATLTDLVWRVFAPDHELGAARRPFRADHLAVPDADRLPLVAFTVLGLDEAGVGRALEAIARVQEETSAFRAVVVVDRPLFAEVRRHGFVADHVIPEADWYGEADAYRDYVARRLVSVVQGFRAWHLVRIGDDGQVPRADRELLAAVGRVLDAALPRRTPADGTGGP